MADGKAKRIAKLGQKVADEVILENPPPDKEYQRADLLGRVGLKYGEETGWTEMHFFTAMNDRLLDKSGRMYVTKGPGVVTFTAKEQTVAISEEMARADADRSMGKHIYRATLTEKHLSAAGRAESARSIARVALLAAQIRMAANEAAEITNTLLGGGA